MASSPPCYLTPRKRLRQARATVTLDAIFEATTQVLLVDGPRGLTTTRVAERAGVSVDTLYQYFPHKQALFYALIQRCLDTVAKKVENACRARRGAPIDQMVEALLTTYWNAKRERAAVTRALYTRSRRPFRSATVWEAAPDRACGRVTSTVVNPSRLATSRS